MTISQILENVFKILTGLQFGTVYIFGLPFSSCAPEAIISFFEKTPWVIIHCFSQGFSYYARR